MSVRARNGCKAISVLIGDATQMSSDLMCRELNRTPKQFRVISGPSKLRVLATEILSRRPDVALISARLMDGPSAGFQLLSQLRDLNCSTRLIMLLDEPDREQVLNAFAGGAKGVMCRTEHPQALRRCIRCVYNGQIWANTEQIEIVLGALMRGRPLRMVNAKGIHLLTEREDEVVHLVLDGFTNEEISLQLRVSLHTVKNHIFRIYEKLGISSRSELILYVLSKGGSSNRTHTRLRDNSSKPVVLLSNTEHTTSV